MRLAIATPFLEDHGGAARIALKIAKHFDASIHCFYYQPEQTFSEFKNLDVQAAKSDSFGKSPPSTMTVTNYFSNLKLDGYDVINAQKTPSELIRNKNPRVIWYCNSPSRQAYDLYGWYMKRKSLAEKPSFWASTQVFKFLESRAVNKIEHIFTASKSSQKRVAKHLKRSSEVLYPGVDAENFSCRDYDNFFFYPSVIAPEKDFEYAIEAFKLFSARFKDWKFVIAGSLSTRSEQQRYYKKLKALCPKSVIIETNMPEERLVDLYSRCYAVLYTPIDEGHSLVPLEAMASSKPCIAKDEERPREFIKEGKDGFLASSIWNMAEKMEWLAKNSNRCKEMGEYGRRKVQRDFTWKQFLKRFEEKARELSKS